ncbi:MAG: nucleotide exchange factor GrpE [Candidatus Thermoplasmatota archaeon]|nr:nucleotide exchange factor GrpE [Candidatus Thermoplasmatota archaeon]
MSTKTMSTNSSKKSTKKKLQQESKKEDTNKQYENKIIQLEKELHEIKKQLCETKDKLLRSYADYQNYQKRIERNLKQTETEIKQIYLSELIDIKELLLNALQDNDPKEGLRLILKQIEHFFNEEQVSYIECIGKPFDHDLHHAVTTIEQEHCDDNIIIEEVKKGYMIEDSVIRPSHVVVAKKKKCEEK